MNKTTTNILFIILLIITQIAAIIVYAIKADDIFYLSQSSDLKNY